MKFLCLHGNGTNSNVMKLQTSPLRHELQDRHTYEFVEATIKVPFSKGLESFASPGDDFFSFYDESDLSTLPQVLRQLDAYIASQGPFDAIMGFSAGAVLAGLYLLDKHRQGVTPLPVRCAVLLSAGSSAAALEALGFDDVPGTGAGAGGEEDGRRIPIPSAHIWGSADDVAPGGGRDLSRLFEPGCRLSLVHDGGHEIPRKSYVTEAAHIIRRVLALAFEG